MTYDIRAEYRSESAAGRRCHYCDVLSCRVIRERRQTVAESVIRGPRNAVAILADLLEGADREYFVALILDAKNRLIGIHTVAIGLLNEALVHPRETFKAAIVMGAAAILVGHNHPSGDPTPSPEDIAMTQRLADAGRILGVELIDHVIVGAPGCSRSLREIGYIA